MASHEAVAWCWNMGEAAPLEEVVLHAQRLGQQAPDAAVAAAVNAMARRRRAGRFEAGALERWEAVQALLGRRAIKAGARSEATEALLAATTPRRPQRPALQAGAPAPLPVLALMSRPPCPFDQDDEVFGFWVEESGAFKEYSAVIQGAAALDHWLQLQPLARETDVGGLVVEARLRALRRLRAGPLLVELGRKALGRAGRYWNGAAPAGERLCYWLDAMAAGAEFGAGELDALMIAKQRLEHAFGKRRKSSSLPALAELLLRTPVVSSNLVAETLRVSPQAARSLLGELDGVVREVTGRGSYRLWRI